MVGMGTPAYMPPELVRGEDPIPQTDIYSLGVMLYEMVTGGERPFTGEHAKTTGSTSEKVRWEQMNLKPPSPRKFNKKISRALEAVVLNCLAKEPGERHASVMQLMNALALALGAEEEEPTAIGEAVAAPITAQEAAVEVPIVAPPRRKEKRAARRRERKPAEKAVAKKPSRAWIWLLGGGAVVAVVVLGMVFGPGLITSPSSTPTPTRPRAAATAPAVIPSEGQSLRVGFVNELLSGAVVDQQEEFEDGASEDWNWADSPGRVLAKQGVLEINGDYVGGDLTWADNYAAFGEGGAGLLLFKFSADADFGISMVHGDWGDAAFRRFWIEPAIGNARVTWAEGDDYNSGNMMEGNLRLKADTWYYLLFAIDEDGQWRAYLWDRYDTSQLLTYWWRGGSVWASRDWWLHLNAFHGEITIESYTLLSFQSYQETPLAEDVFWDGYSEYLGGDHDWAHELFSTAIDRDATIPYFYRMRGNASWASGDIDGAYDDYLEALDVDPQYYWAISNLASIYLHEDDWRDYDQAMSYANDMIDVDSELPQGYARRANIEEWLGGDVEAAIGDYELAVELGPAGDLSWYASLGFLWVDNGEYGEAVAICNRCLDVRHDYADCHLARARAYAALGRVSDAVDDYQIYLYYAEPDWWPEMWDEAQEYVDQHG
jgi:tetratricopeptide (TPR) repeat protein